MERQRTLANVLKDYPKEVILKDGTGITLRSLADGDQDALYRMFHRFPKDELWFLNHDVNDRALIDQWIVNLNSRRVVSIVALLEGRVIANAVLMMKEYGAKKHIGKIRIAVAPDMREKRLGTWMLLDLINLGVAIGLRILVMRLIEDRDIDVIQGVKKLDFVERAILKDYVLDMEENPHNLVLLTKRLHTRWDDF
jgi:GNAT superfamily N-acetyltransferase